jgi:hypothetical protein
MLRITAGIAVSCSILSILFQQNIAVEREEPCTR